MTPKIAANPIIVALDVPSADEAVALVTRLTGAVGAFKIGLELFNAEGPRIFERLRAAGGGDVQLFYDAKFHDIPNTVAGAMRAALKHGVWMVNVHASGGGAMIRAAVEAANDYAGQRPLVIAVTVLTSVDTATLNDELGVAGDARDQVVRLARLAQESGADGVVASPQEAEAIRAACGARFVIVTPGVRPAGADVADQKRIATPAAAIAAGANYLVVGRPITQASDPRAAAHAILDEITAEGGAIF
jgi:orotidine-5'-phosphate decarboxylase